MEFWQLVVIIVLGILALGIALCLLVALVIGAIALFVWASEAGFIGVAVYFACWVFMFPLMIIGCIIVGGVTWWTERTEERS